MIRTEHYKNINRTPALAMATRCWLELLDAGLTENVGQVGWDHQAIVAFEDNTPVGCITFTNAEYDKTTNIIQGYVVPDYRGRGIYREMWNCLVGHARIAGSVKIIGITYMRNAAMRAVAEKLGRTEEGVVLGFLL